MANEVASLIAYFGADTTDFNRGVGDVRAGLGRADGSFINTRKIALGAFTAIGIGAAAAAAEATDMSIKFQAVMADVQAASGRSAAEQAKWSEMVLQAGMRATEGPQSVAMAYYDAVSAIEDADMQFAVLNESIQLDNASDAQTQLASIADLTINLANVYADTAEELDNLNDITGRMIQTGKGTAGQFSAAISPILTLNEDLGVSYEELASTVAFMTTRGMSQAQAATRQEAIISALIKPNSQLQKVMKELNITSFETVIAQNGLVGTLEILDESIGSSSQRWAELVGTQEAVAGTVTLLDDSYATFNQTFKEGIAGSIGDMQAIKLQDTAVKMDLLKAKVQGLAIAFGSELAPAAGTAIDVLSAGVDFIADLTGLSADEPIKIEVPDPYAEARQVAVPTTVMYEIQAGDTLWSIAAANDTTVEAILAANPQITNAGMIYAGDTLIIPVDGQVDMNVAMGDMMFSKADLEFLAELEQGASGAAVGATRADRAFDNLETRLEEISGIEWDLSSIQKGLEDIVGLGELTGVLFDAVGDKLNLGEQLAIFNEDVNKAADELGIDLDIFSDYLNLWWDTFPLNPAFAGNVISGIADASGQFASAVGTIIDTIDSGLESVGIGVDQVAVQFVADDSQYASGDELVADYFGEIIMPILFQPTDEVPVGEELFDFGAQVNFDEAQAAADAAGLEVQVATIMVDENGMPLNETSFADLGINPELPFYIIPVDEGGNPIDDIPQYIMNMVGGFDASQVKIAPSVDTAGLTAQMEADWAVNPPKIPLAMGAEEGIGQEEQGRGLSFNVTAIDEYEIALDNMRAVAEDPLKVTISEAGLQAIDKARLAINELARDREVKIKINLELGAGSQYFGAAVAAGAFALPGRAEGGPVSAGQPYLVGEEGPEIFTPGTSGRIIPNDELGGSKSAVGGMSINGGQFHIYGVQDVEGLYDKLQDVGNRRGG